MALPFVWQETENKKVSKGKRGLCRRVYWEFFFERWKEEGEELKGGNTKYAPSGSEKKSKFEKERERAKSYIKGCKREVDGETGFKWQRRLLELKWALYPFFGELE